MLFPSALGKNIIENTYGIRITSPSSEACPLLCSIWQCTYNTWKYVKLSRETHEVIQNAVIPGSFFVDVFPARMYPLFPARENSAHARDLAVRFVPEWFPGAGFKRLARVAKARGEHMVDGAFDAAKKAMIGENSMESLVGTLLSREEPEEMTREEYEYTIKWAAGSLYGGM